MEGAKTTITGNDSNFVYIKSESPSKDGDNEDTPVREESFAYLTNSNPSQHQITVTGGASWESDVEDEQHAAPILETSINQSPNLQGNEQTPLRVSYIDTTENIQHASVPPALLSKEIQTLNELEQIPLGIPDILSSQQADMPLKQSRITNDYDETPLRISEPAESEPHAVGVAHSFLDDLTEPVLPHSNIENQRRLNLGFLDVPSEADSDTNSLSQANVMDKMDLEPPIRHGANNHEESEENELQSHIEQRRKQLESLKRTHEVKKIKIYNMNKTHDDHKRRRRSESHSRSSSPTCSFNRSRSSSVSPVPQRTCKNNDLERSSGMKSTSILNEPVRAEKTCLSFVRIDKLMQPEIGSTIERKRQLGLERAKSVLQAMHLKACKAPDNEFLVVDTIKKLHSSATYMKCGIFDNPSPLCNNNNVKYKFNSTSSSTINLKRWGLESLPRATTALLRLTGIDVSRLMELQRNSKMLMRKANEEENATANTEEAGMGLYKSISTQTDSRIINFSRDVAVQAMPVSYRGVYWLHPQFNETNLSQQEINVMMALKELSASSPSSPSWADKLFRELRRALAIKRAEAKKFGQ